MLTFPVKGTVPFSRDCHSLVEIRKRESLIVCVWGVPFLTDAKLAVEYSRGALDLGEELAIGLCVGNKC